MKEDNTSHNFKRIFKPYKLKPPRGFRLPQFVLKNLKNTDEYDYSVDTHKQTNHKTKVNKQYNIDACKLSTPLIVEIGAGKGKHALTYAQENPDKNLIAIERTRTKYKTFEKLLSKKPLNNLKAVHADAIPYCVYALAPATVDAFYILYPNPEQKNPNQQWLNMPFFEFLLSRLKVDGKIILTSNIKSYIDNAQYQAVHTWNLDTQLYQVNNDSCRTHFEIKYLQRGETCWELKMIKPKGYVTHFDKWLSSELINGFENNS